jgi:hypothetical protein
MNDKVQEETLTSSRKLPLRPDFNDVTYYSCSGIELIPNDYGLKVIITGGAHSRLAMDRSGIAGPR